MHAFIYIAIFLGTLNVASAIKSWVDEKQHYDYSRNKCSKVCGHYTQVGIASCTFCRSIELDACQFIVTKKSVSVTYTSTILNHKDI